MQTPPLLEYASETRIRPCIIIFIEEIRIRIDSWEGFDLPNELESGPHQTIA